MEKKYNKRLLSLICAGLIAALCTALLYGFFPAPYRDTVEDCAIRYGVESSLIYAVLKAESNFDPAAVSRAGAKGLAQLTDATAQYAAEMAGEEYGFGDAFDAEKSIGLAAVYLRYLLRKYDGDQRRATAAYNAGEGNVDKWLSADGDMKEIPFGETKKYVNKVKWYKRVYSLLYN